MKSVYIVNADPLYIRMFQDGGWGLSNSLSDADLIQFTGGEDVSPNLYGRHPHPHTYFNPMRDNREALIFQRGFQLGIPMAGICRGGQFLNVMCGGELWQHVPSHTRPHYATDVKSKEEFLVTSTHHQMMIPSQQGEIVVTAKLSEWKETATKITEDMKVLREPPDIDVEAVYYKNWNVFCFQPHPEFSNVPDLAKRYLQYLETYLFKE